MNATRAVAALWLALLSSSPAVTQIRQPPPLPPVPRPQTPSTPQFRSAVDLVHLDVSVLDRDRQPVRGLAPADFTILEDGVAQTIAVFTAVEVPHAAAPAAAWMRDVAPDVRTNDRIEERRLFLLIIDDAMIQADAEALKNTRTIARQVIDRLGPSDLAAVVYTADNRKSQDYTADRARLLGAVEKFRPAFRDMSQLVPDDLYWVYSADVVRRAIEVMSTAGSPEVDRLHRAGNAARSGARLDSASARSAGRRRRLGAVQTGAGCADPDHHGTRVP